MPTFRADPKLGTMVPQLKTADLNDKCVTTEKLADASVTEVKLAIDIVERVNNATTAANSATENANAAAEKAKGAQEDAERQTMVMEDLQGEITTSLEKVDKAVTDANNAVINATAAAKNANAAAEKAAGAADHEERIITIEGDIESILSDISNCVKRTDYNLKVMALETSINDLKSKLNEYCSMTLYTVLKDTVDELAERVSALENK